MLRCIRVYQLEKGKDACIDCPRGWSTLNGFESISCTRCSRKYTNQTGSRSAHFVFLAKLNLFRYSLCLKCAPGKHTDERSWAIACQNAPGKVFACIWQRHCIPCASGSSAGAGQPACKFVPRDIIRNNNKASVPVPC